MAQVEDWLQYATVLDTAAADRIDVALELPSMLVARAPEPAAGNPESRPLISDTARAPARSHRGP